MMGLRDAIERQRNIRRSPRRVEQPRISVPQAPPGDAATFVLGKVIEINHHSEDVRLAPIKTGRDPRDPDVWGDNANFDMAGVLCCWTMGFPVCDLGWPGVAMLTQGGYVLLYAIRLEPANPDPETPHTFCMPEGILAPELVPDCEPLPDPGICTTKFACCLVDASCQELNDVECAAAGGQYYGPDTELGGDDGRHCVGVDDGDVTCEPLFGCLHPTTFECVDVPAGECQAGWMALTCTCAEFWQPPPGCP